MVSGREGYGGTGRAGVAGELATWRGAGTAGAAGATDAAGSCADIFAGDIHWRGSRGSPGGGSRGDRGVRSCGRPDGFSESGCGTFEAAGAVSGRTAAVAAEKDFLFSGRGARRHFQRQGPIVFGEGDFEIDEEAVLAGFAGRVSRASDAGEEFCRPVGQNGRRRDRKNDAGRRLGGRAEICTGKVARGRKRDVADFRECDERSDRVSTRGNFVWGAERGAGVIDGIGGAVEVLQRVSRSASADAFTTSGA